MHIENATRTRAFVVPLVENWVSPAEEPVEEFLHVLEDSISHDEVWPQPYHQLYVSLLSGRSMKKGPDVDEDAEPALRFDTEPVVEPEELEPLPSNEVLAEDSPQSEVPLDDGGNRVPDTSTDTDDLPDIDMDRLLRVTFGKELRYAPALTELMRCRRHRDGTLQPVPLPKVGPNTTYLSSLKGTHRQVHRHYQCKDLTSTAVWAAGYREVPRTRHMYKSQFEALRHDINSETPSCLSIMASSSICRQWASVWLFLERSLPRLWPCITSPSFTAIQEYFEPWR